jgi:hypothetical protein
MAAYKGLKNMLVLVEKKEKVVKDIVELLIVLEKCYKNNK